MSTNFKAYADEIARLLEEKQKAYGDSARKTQEVLKIYFPNGIRPDQYIHVHTIIRSCEKFFRIANRQEGAKDAGGESPYLDLTGISMLAWMTEDPEIGKAPTPPAPSLASINLPTADPGKSTAVCGCGWVFTGVSARIAHGAVEGHRFFCPKTAIVSIATPGAPLTKYEARIYTVCKSCVAAGWRVDPTSDCPDCGSRDILNTNYPLAHKDDPFALST